MVLMINGTSISATAYTDATKTEAITLPGWRPAAQAEAHAWIQVDADTQVITFTVSDAYHTGKPITITVPQAFRTFDFLKGGKGITAGAIAEEEGFHFAMEPFFRTLAGVIQMYAGTTPPNGWAFCDGSELSISDYPELFAAIGNTYGVASDTSHFILPDLQSRFPIGADSSYPPGDTGGSADAIVPYHRHSVPAVTNAITGGSHHHATYRKKNAGSGSAIYVPDGGSTSNGISTTDTTHTHNLPAHNTAYEGDPLVGANIPPYLGINFIIHLGRPTRSI